MRAVRDRNAGRLTAIIEPHGWPGRRPIGGDGSRAALLLWGLVPLREPVAGGVVALFEGRPQRHGTQCDWSEGGGLSPWAIADLDGWDERRAAVGLPPVAEDTARIRGGRRPRRGTAAGRP